jgi:hypothetical protein
MEPYAGYLLRRFRAGESLEQLEASEAIPRERITVRLKAALRHERTQAGKFRSRVQETPHQLAA